MKICIISGNPKSNGLCQSVIDNLKQGIIDGGAQAVVVRLCDYKLIKCQVCGDGWGKCRNENYCTYEKDGFDEITQKIKSSDALIIVTPVYWGEMSEDLKCFIDRLRRCEFNNDGVLKAKQVILVASAGGSGNGVMTCLEQMDRFSRHTGMVIFDYIAINRWNSDYKKIAAKAAAYNLAMGRKNGDTV